jgi:hypothetical protein
MLVEGDKAGSCQTGAYDRPRSSLKSKARRFTAGRLLTSAHHTPDDRQRHDQQHGKDCAPANRSFPPVGVYAKA